MTPVKSICAAVNPSMVALAPDSYVYSPLAPPTWCAKNSAIVLLLVVIIRSTMSVTVADSMLVKTVAASLANFRSPKVAETPREVRASAKY